MTKATLSLGVCGLVLFASQLFGGLIVQPSNPGPITPGNIDFDVILANESNPPAPAIPEIWEDIIFVGPVEFMILQLGGPAVTVSNLAEVAPWEISPIVTGPGETNFSLPISEPAITLNPGDQFTFATLTLNIPSGFTGDFDIVLADTSTSLTVIGETLIDATNNWFGDTPPLPLAPPPGGGAPTGFMQTFSVTAVPEPSPIVSVGLIGALLCALNTWRRKTIA